MCLLLQQAQNGLNSEETPPAAVLTSDDIEIVSNSGESHGAEEEDFMRERILEG